MSLIKGVGKTIPKIYEDLLQSSVQTLGEAIEGPVKLVTIPLRLLGPFSQHLETNLNSWLEEKLQNVPPEEQIIPKTNIAYPIMQNLVINLDDELLRDGFLNLLANAVSQKHSSSVRKSFPYILEQMTDTDALLFKELYFKLNHANIHGRSLHPIITIEKIRENNDRSIIYSNVFISSSILDYHNSVLSLENLKRLNLIEVDYSVPMADKSNYDPLQKHPLVDKVRSSLQATQKLDCRQGFFYLTSLGKAFGEVALIPPDQV